MPQGDKSSYSAKQRRKAEHIEKSYEKRGVSAKTAAKRAWATVNKTDKGTGGHSAAKKKQAARKAAPSTSSSRSEAAKKGWRTRRRNAKR